MLGEVIQQQQRKIYLNIKDGAIVKRTDNGEVSYKYLDGQVERIFQKERTFRGEKVIYWYIDMRDKDSNELYSLGFPYGSNVFKSIILALVSDEALTNKKTVRIEPYKKNGYDKVTVFSGGVKLDWIVNSLPAIETVSIGGRAVKDDSKRMKLITDAVAKIQQRISQKPN